LQALAGVQAQFAAHGYVIQERARGAVEVLNKDAFIGEVQLGVFVGDIFTFGVDRAIGIAADDMHSFAQEVLGDDGSVMLKHQNFDADISHGMGI
jgi:hypothetical protein